MIVLRNGIYYAAWRYKGKLRWQTTDTGKKALAIKRSLQYREALRSEKWDKLNNILSPSKETTDLSRVYKIYEEEAHRWARPATVTANVNCLKRILKFPSVREYASSKITDANKDQKKVATAVRTIQSEIRQAKSLFSRDAMATYALEGFFPQKPDFNVVLPNMRGKDAVGFTAFDAAAWDTFQGVMEFLRESNSMVYRYFVMMSKCGMRPAEVDAANKSWLTETHITVRQEPYYTPKTKKAYRSIPITPEVFQLLTTEKGRLIVGDKKKIKSLLNHSFHRYFPDRIKRSYELRKHAGSIILTRDGAEAAAAFLGDNMQTIQKYYVTYLDELKAI